MVTKKLTLSIDEDVIKQAKKLAAQNHTSVSGMFTRIVREWLPERRTTFQSARSRDRH
jgi:hypothetical protein